MEDGWADVPEGDAGRSLPPWGLPGVAVAYEADSAGDWAMVSAAPTRFAAGEAPGLEVLDVSEAPGTVTLRELGEAMTCLGHRRAGTGCEGYDGVIPESVSTQLGDAFDEVGSLAFEGGTLIFPIVYGDGPHIEPPVFLDCGPACEPVLLRLATDAPQLSLSAKGPYLLVGREHSLTEGAIFAPGSAEPILMLPAEASNVWLPR